MDATGEGEDATGEGAGFSGECAGLTGVIEDTTCEAAHAQWRRGLRRLRMYRGAGSAGGHKGERSGTGQDIAYTLLTTRAGAVST